MVTFTSNNRIPQSVQFNDDNIIITDPCYLLSDDQWDEYLNKEMTGVTLVEYFKSLGFTKVVGGDTGVGDWCNEIKDSKEVILGQFTADAGMLVAVASKELEKLGGITQTEFIRLLRNGCIAEIPDFTGTVELNYTNGVAVISGVSSCGKFSFTSDEM